MGDGVLVEFASAVSAVQCAVDLQQAMAAPNRELSEDRQIMLRIGINLGDVMVEGGDLYGDGVNIAARLEGLAEPGGILISGTAYDQVRNRVRSGFDDLGTQNLKNMIEPVRVYRVTLAAETPVVPRMAASKPSIAVLPFTNMSGDRDQQYFSDGITEDIITELSRFPSLLVIARNSSFRYRDSLFDMKQIGRELCAHYLVERSIRRRVPSSKKSHTVCSPAASAASSSNAPIFSGRASASIARARVPPRFAGRISPRIAHPSAAILVRASCRHPGDAPDRPGGHATAMLSAGQPRDQ
jgi:hypothetical protein